ncbi:MAG: hypothetical protein RL685_3079 [Pseudomonadota bacterium]
MVKSWKAVRVGTACALVLVASVLGIACADVLGDVVVEGGGAAAGQPLPPGPTTGGQGGPSTGVSTLEPCEPGQVRCSGALFQACVRGSSNTTVWLRVDDCKQEALCVSGPDPGCLTRPCVAGETSCDGATPRVCSAAEDGWEPREACPSAAHCSINPGDCRGAAPCCLESPCAAGEMRCNQGEMQRCNDTQTAWDILTQCDTPDLCLAGLSACVGTGSSCACEAAVCEVNATRCTGTTLERCNAGRTGFEPVDLCATPELCEVTQALGLDACKPPPCDVGDHLCTDEGVLLGCRIDRTDYIEQEPCIGPQFCNASVGVCEPAECDSGQQRCNGTQIEECLEDRTGFRSDGLATCATPALCDDTDPGSAACEPPQCGVNEFNCFGGAQLQRCNADRTHFEPFGPPCLRPDLCSAPRGRCDFCFPGRQECTPELDASRVCSVTGNSFGPETFCPLGCDGPLGTCRTCQPGSYRCTGNFIERCSSDGRSFTPINRSSDCSGAATQVSCFNGQLLNTNCGAPGCNLIRAQCNECSGTQRICTGGGFRQCNGGVFGPTQDCGSGLSCSGAGTCGCDAGTLRCSNDTLQVCTGAAFVATEFCDGDLLISCASGIPEVVQCSSADDCDDSDGLFCE